MPAGLSCRLSFTNRDSATVAAMLNASRARFGDSCIMEEAAQAAADKKLMDQKGKELKGPLLIVVDKSGAIISKQPCPRTTPAKQRELKDEVPRWSRD